VAAARLAAAVAPAAPPAPETPPADDALPLAEPIEEPAAAEPGEAGDAAPEALPSDADAPAPPTTVESEAPFYPVEPPPEAPQPAAEPAPESDRTPLTKTTPPPDEPPSSEVRSTNQSELASADHRRLDVDGKQELVAKLLHDTGCEGLLVLHPANFRWLTAGAAPAGLAGRDETPALYFNSHQRWLVCSATDSARLFADELDGLGFQLKEWLWVASREQLLADLVFGRKVASDQPFRDCKSTGPFFAHTRRRLSAYEVQRLGELGETVAHAVEATARHFDWGDSEEEIAGHLAHRLLRHGAEPVALQVSGDGRARPFRRRGFRPDRVERWCVLQATGRKFGLHATAARTVFRTPPDDTERAEFEAALRVRVTHLAVSKRGDRVYTALDAGVTLVKSSPFEHEWRLAPPVCLTGREPSEGVFLATAQDKWLPGWAAVWQERIGAAAVVDTYLMEDAGWRPVTRPSLWPVRRALSRGRTFELADFLVRGD
jgi:Xaa-Pro dipeptidase